MRLVKIGLANIDPTIGAFKSNSKAIMAAVEELARQDCMIACFPEQAISGYAPEDLVQWQGFVRQQWEALRQLAKDTMAYPYTSIVFVIGVTVEWGGSVYNCAAVLLGGEILGIVPKEKLPTYGVFYERRTFSAGQPGLEATIDGVPFGDFIFQFPFGTLAVDDCEDIWSVDGPMRRRCYSGAELVINISASPWRAGVVGTRREMLSTRAADNCATIVYINQVGGNDSLVYDGGGFVNQGGRMLHEAPRWKTDVSATVVDLDRTTRQRRENSTWRMDRELFLEQNKRVRCIEVSHGTRVGSYPYPIPAAREPGELPSFFIPAHQTQRDPRTEYFEDLTAAMVMGLKGYFEKTGAFKRIGIALSGGKDSALTLLIAHRYASERFADLAPEARSAPIRDLIHCLSFPTGFNSEESKSVARDLATELGVSFKEVPIGTQVEEMTALARNTLGRGGRLEGVTLQNIQARVRGGAMWNWANCHAGLWLQSGNMSEKAVGYTTIGGDLMGGYSLIGNLPKTVEVALLDHLNKTHYNSPIIEQVIRVPASAGLAEGQETEKDLMPFPVLDACYALFVGEKMMPSEVLTVLWQMFTAEQLEAMYPGYTPKQMQEWVKRFVLLFRKSIFKWVQAPQTVHLGSLDLDRERALQLPVVFSDEWLLLNELNVIP